MFERDCLLVPNAISITAAPGENVFRCCHTLRDDVSLEQPAAGRFHSRMPAHAINVQYSKGRLMPQLALSGAAYPLD